VWEESVDHVDFTQSRTSLTNTPVTKRFGSAANRLILQIIYGSSKTVFVVHIGALLVNTKAWRFKYFAISVTRFHVE
jgi:hypothetical protein